MQDGGNPGEGPIGSAKESYPGSLAAPPISNHPPLLFQIRAEFLQLRGRLLPLRSDGRNRLRMLRRPRPPPAARRRGRRWALTGHSERGKQRRNALMLSTPSSSARNGCKGCAGRLPPDAATRATRSIKQKRRRDPPSNPHAASAANPCTCIEAFARKTPSRHRGALGRSPNRNYAPNLTTADSCEQP